MRSSMPRKGGCGTRDQALLVPAYDKATALAVDTCNDYDKRRSCAIKQYQYHAAIIHPDTQAMHQGIDAVGKSDLEKNQSTIIGNAVVYNG